MDSQNELFWQLLKPEDLRARRFCRKLCKNSDDGDDLYHDALVKALGSFDSLKDRLAFKSWLYRIIVNHFKNRQSRSWWQKILPLAEAPEPSVSNAVDRRQTARQRLEIAFSSLSSADKALIMLYEVEGWNLDELSRMTGKTIASLKMRLSRARRKMRQTLIKKFRLSADDKSHVILLSEDDYALSRSQTDSK